MPFARPTLQELIDRTSADFSTRLGIGPLLRRSNLWILARVWSGMVNGLHGHLEWITKQILVDSAEKEFLERHGTIDGIARLAPTPALGTVRFTGQNGIEIPAATLVQRVDGEQFATDAAGTISGGQVDVAVTASEAREKGNTDVAIELSLVTPISGIDSTPVTVQNDGSGGGLTGGADQETDEKLRDRILLRRRTPPMGGSEADYEQWTREIAGVTRVWIVPIWAGPGTVLVYFARDDDSDGPLPSAGEVTTVLDHINTERPVTATVTVSAPTLLDLDPAITLTPNEAAVRAAVTANLDDLFLRDAEVKGVSHTFPISKIREAISNAVGETDHVLTAPTADVTVAAGELLVTGTPVYS